MAQFPRIRVEVGLIIGGLDAVRSTKQSGPAIAWKSIFQATLIYFNVARRLNDTGRTDRLESINLPDGRRIGRVLRGRR